MHHSKKAKPNNRKRIMKTALFLDQRGVHSGHTHTQGNPHKVLPSQPRLNNSEISLNECVICILVSESLVKEGVSTFSAYMFC